MGAIVALLRSAKMQLLVESQRPAATPNTAASVLARAGLAATVWAISSAVAVALLIQPAEARSRDFAAPPEPEEAPLPRSGPLSLSFALGAGYLHAGWRENFPPPESTDFSNGGPAIQLRFGVPRSSNSNSTRLGNQRNLVRRGRSWSRHPSRAGRQRPRAFAVRWSHESRRELRLGHRYEPALSLGAILSPSLRAHRVALLRLPPEERKPAVQVATTQGRSFENTPREDSP